MFYLLIRTVLNLLSNEKGYESKFKCLLDCFQGGLNSVQSHGVDRNKMSFAPSRPMSVS